MAKKRKAKPKHAAEKKAYKNFTGRLQATAKAGDIKWPEKLVYMGIAKELNYSTDKQVGHLIGGKMRDYVHHLKQHGKVWMNPQGTMVIIKGLKIKMKKEGITG